MLPKFFMTLSIFTRMLVGLVVFALIARGLGPREFGFVSLVFSYASLGSLLTDFGLSLKTLRDIAHRPQDGRGILSATLGLKTLLSVAVGAAGCIVVLLLPMSAEARVASCLLTAGVMTASFGDLALVAFRSTKQFGRESWIVGWTSLLYGVVLGGVVYGGCGIMPISAAFLACRLIYAYVAMQSAMGLFPRTNVAVKPPGLLAMVKSAWSWALLSNLSYINGQIDSMFIAPLLGLHATGIYQAGAKFMASAVTFAAVVLNTQVPSIAAAAANGAPTLRLELLAWLQMIAVGFAAGLTLTLGGPLITRYLIGNQYAEVNALWLGLGVLAFCRFLSSSILVSLVALDRSKTNLIGEAATTVVSIPLMILLLPRYGLISVPWIMSAGALATATVLLLGRIHIHIKPGLSTALKEA